MSLSDFTPPLHEATGAKKAPRSRSERGFSLLEIIIVMAVLSILAVAITLVINPVERLREARDATRLSDAKALADAILFMEADISGGVAVFDYDGSFPDDSCAGDATPRIFVSVPDSEMAPPPPAGWTYAQVVEANLYDTGGSGWVPIDFTANAAGPIERLPVDPTNTFASGLYYSYVCGGSFEVNVVFESDKFVEEAAGDGGDASGVFEVGSSLTSAPARPLIVANNPPTITDVNDDESVTVGTSMNFIIDWNDSDRGEQVKAYICKSNTMTVPHVCDSPGVWVETVIFESSETINLPPYVTKNADIMGSPNGYWAFVCDDGDLCSSPYSGTFDVTSGMASTGFQRSDNTTADPADCDTPTPLNFDDSIPASDAEVVRCQPSSAASPKIVFDGFTLDDALSSGTIDGIVVLLDDVSAKADFTGTQHFEVRLWRSGTGWTNASTCATLDISETNYSGATGNYQGVDLYCDGTGTLTGSVPGTGTNWGQFWAPADFAPANFRVEVRAVSDDAAAFQWIRFDTIQVNVYYN